MRKVFWCVPAALAVGVFLFLVPARAAVFNPESFTLKNGLKVIVIPNHRAPVVTHMIYYNVGAMDEPPGKTGLAHFLEHLMFKGTKSLKPGEFSAIVARNGGRENAFTSNDYTGYFQTVAADRLGAMMRWEADRMVNLTLTGSDIEPERKVILEERNARVENSPAALLQEHVDVALYKNHPYRRPTIGWAHEVKALSRDDLMRFYRRWYAPNNAVLVLSGDVTAAKVRPLVEKYYGKIPARTLPARPEWREPPHSAARRVELRHKQVGQPGWSRRFLAPSYRAGAREHVYALQVLAEILGGGSTGRLYRSLAVDAKVAAGAGAWYGPNARGPGVFGVYAGPLPGKTIEQVEALVEKEIRLLLEKGVTEKEVRNAVVRLQDEAVYARDSIGGPARVLGGAVVIGMTIEDVESWPDRVGAVTREAVNAAARAVLRDGYAVTSVLLPEKSN
jgi:zinc protease